GKHQRNGARLEFRRSVVGGGEAELLHEGIAGADYRKAEGEQPETRLEKRDCRDKAAERGDGGSRHEAVAMAEPANDPCRGQCADRQPNAVAGERRRRQRLVGAEHEIAGKRAERKTDRPRRPEHRLGRRQDDRGAARLALAGGGGHILAGGTHEASLPRPSPRTRRDTRSSTALTSFGSSSV